MKARHPNNCQLSDKTRNSLDSGNYVERQGSVFYEDSMEVRKLSFTPEDSMEVNLVSFSRAVGK